MKMLYALGATLFLTKQFLCPVYAIEICEPRDYYSLANSSKCSISENKAGDKEDANTLVLELLKNYPYEQRDAFIQVLQRKIELLETNITRRQGLGATEKAQADISTLEYAKQDLSRQLVMVNAATRDNWISVRDRARKALEEAAKRLRDVK